MDFPTFLLVVCFFFFFPDTANRQEEEYNCQTASGFHSSCKTPPMYSSHWRRLFFRRRLTRRKSKIPHPSRRFFVFVFIFLQQFSSELFWNNNVRPLHIAHTTRDKGWILAPWHSWSFQTCFRVSRLVAPGSPFPADYAHAPREKGARFNSNERTKTRCDVWRTGCDLFSRKKPIF